MRNKIYKFMQGRYGFDELYMFMFYLYIILLMINVFLNSNILSILELILVAIMFYRVFSKNTYQRRKENNRYLKFKSRVFNTFKKEKIKKDNEHLYKKCHKCNTIIRLPLPSTLGVKYVTCPKCKNKLKVLALRKQKIELIRKKHNN